MGMLVAPYRFAVVGGLNILGNNAAATGNVSLSSGFMQGPTFVASASFTATKFFIRGHGTTSYTEPYRLCVYGPLPSSTNWTNAPLVGQTADQASLNTGELKEIASLAGMTIASGSTYAICVHMGGAGMAHASNGGSGRAFGDTYADGPVALAAASFANAASQSCIWISD